MGGFEGVAAVVAGAGENEDWRRAIEADRGRQFGGGLSSALHQRQISKSGFDAAQVGRVIECDSGHGLTQKNERCI